MDEAAVNTTGRRIVVTGASSFIGAHLAANFARAGWEVLATTTRGAAEYEGVRAARLDFARSAGARLTILNMTDADGLARFVGEVCPAVWVNHAGWATGYADADYDLARGHEVNVQPLGTLYPLLKRHGCRGVIVTGSSAEYGASDRPSREGDACEPTTPYGLSKLCETLHAGLMATRVGLPTRVARVFIPFGPLDAPGKLLPSVIRHLRAGEAIELSPCRQVRDFLHIRDLADGYALLVDDLARDSLFDVFNLCSGAGTTLAALLTELAELIGADAELLRFGALPVRAGEPLVSHGANDKAARLLGWRPGTLREGLAECLGLAGVDARATSHAGEAVAKR